MIRIHDNIMEKSLPFAQGCYDYRSYVDAVVVLDGVDDGDHDDHDRRGLTRSVRTFPQQSETRIE
jgi:hypothetical protein